MDERGIVAVRDDDECPRSTIEHRNRQKHGAGQRWRLERRGFDGDEDLQVDRVIAIGFLDRDAVMFDVRRGMRREVRMHRCRVVIVVSPSDVRVQERRAHGADLNGHRQPEREHSANHLAILAQNCMVVG